MLNVFLKKFRFGYTQDGNTPSSAITNIKNYSLFTLTVIKAFGGLVIYRAIAGKYIPSSNPCYSMVFPIYS